jgi:pyrimidine-nucleoside phosphorylase
VLIVELIAQKQRGESLTAEQIEYLIQGFTRGDVPDYQMSALLMAIYFRGVTDQEGRLFLNSMIRSGKRLNLSAIPGTKVDKHSTGGVGDKTSLIIAPVLAVAGVPVPMISGRGLGHTGGTLDKLESIPGFYVHLSDEEFERILKQTGCAFGAQTTELVPADRKLYALRDVTATVSIPPLIAASILSKKIAEGTNALVMDVKVGEGGFLRDQNEAEELAKMLVRWSAEENVETIAFGTNMDKPLGKAAGNGPEVKECLDILKTGQGDAQLIALSRALGAGMLMLGGKSQDLPSGEKLFDEILDSGAGFEKFKEIAIAQGANPFALDHYEQVSVPKFKHEFFANSSGYLTRVHPQEIGWALVDLGAGRYQSVDTVDHTAGIIFEKQQGDPVKAGDLLATACWSTPRNEKAALSRFEKAMVVGEHKAEDKPLLMFRCDKSGLTKLI